MSPTLPYPEFTDTAPAVPVSSRSLLTFGREAAFLDLDFPSLARPELITRLLALSEWAPGATAEEAPLWSLSVATRLKRLLRLARETLGLTALPVRLRCEKTSCGQTLEIELPLTELEALHNEADDGKLLQFPGPFAFRRPTGNDLRTWRDSPADATSPDTVLRRLLVTEPEAAPPVILPPLDSCAEAFSEFDALVAFRVASACPHCSHENASPIDLEALALGRLEALQQRLYRENHRLARTYGWSEADILRVPRHRRQRYLALVEETA